MIKLTISNLNENDISDFKDFIKDHTENDDEEIIITEISKTSIEVKFESTEVLEFIKDNWIEECDDITYTEEHDGEIIEPVYYNLIVKADQNDCDYITETSRITSEQLDKFRPLFKVIKEHKGEHNWSTFESFRSPEKQYRGKVSEELINKFGEYVPRGAEGEGVHTIESIEVFPFVKMIEKII